MRLVGIFVGFYLCSLPAAAWHEASHRATAEIAFGLLSTVEQQLVIDILRTHPRFDEDFAAHMPVHISEGDTRAQSSWLLQQASIWPDLIRRLDGSIRHQYNNSRWHYVNLPVWLTPEDERAMTGHLNHNMDTIFTPPMRPGLNAIQALRGNLQIWRDTNTPSRDKAISLCWILHLTGDLHQPLHTVALFNQTLFPSGDRGGNSIKVRRGKRTSNLHAFWDELPTPMMDLASPSGTLVLIDEDISDDSIDIWLHDHAELARQFVYTDVLKAQILAVAGKQEAVILALDENYLSDAQKLARKQVNLAGQRVAKLLAESTDK